MLRKRGQVSPSQGRGQDQKAKDFVHNFPDTISATTGQRCMTSAILLRMDGGMCAWALVCVSLGTHAGTGAEIEWGFDLTLKVLTVRDEETDLNKLL